VWGKWFAEDPSPEYSSQKNSPLEKNFPGGGKLFARAFFVGYSFARIIFRRKVLRSDDPSLEDSSPKYYLPGFFFAG
jgi:hypothetical protein